MSISSIIVGGQGCSILKVISTLRSSTSFHLFHEKYADISIDLETPREVIKKFKLDFLLDKLTLLGVVHGLVEDWVARNGSKATLKELVGILEDNGLRDCAESLEKAFTDPTSSPISYRKYSRIPPGVNDFLSNSNNLKTICIIPTPDVPITCDKLHENLKDCIIHEYDDFLKVVSVPTSGNPDPYYVSISSLKQIKKVLTDILDQPGEKIKLIVVTPSDNQEGLMDLLQSHSNWDQATEVCIDPMEWNDLTRAHKNEIGKIVKERFNVDLDDDDDEENNGLSGKNLADLIHGNDFKLFKDTFPEELKYYVFRTLLTRHYISPKIFEQASPDIFLFTGIKRYELSILVKNKRTDQSASQVQRRNLEVSHIIMNHPSHFDKISEKSIAPVHLLHFENGRLRLLRSSGGVEVLQKNLEETQETWRENLVPGNLGAASNLPVIISDSPGMGKSVLLAQIGKTLIKERPESNVFYIVLTEFLKQVKEAGLEERPDTALRNLLCENIVSKTILLSKLKANEGITIELLMDGFDELDANEAELGMRIFQTINKSFKSTRLWVTSRQHMLFQLENALDSLGFNIQPFSEEDQIKFLISYWSRNRKPFCERKLTQFAKECLLVLKSNMNKKQQDIAGPPLQCMLIGEVYEEEAIVYANSEQVQFPTIFPASITNLYASTIATKFKKYHNANRNGATETAISENKLMNLHARLSLELLFPELIRKIEHVFGDVKSEAEIAEVLKVGILESASLTSTPRFIHRTFAEYFVAWYFVNRLEIPEAINFLLDSLFSCHDSFSNNGEVHSFVFANPVVCYFIDNLLTDNSGIKICEVTSINNSPNDVESMTRIAHSCVNADLVQLFKFKFLVRMNMFETHEQAVFTKDLLLLAIEKCGVELIKLILYRFEKQHNFDLRVQVISLNAAVQKGNYYMVEYLINERELRLTAEKIPEDARTILHDCVTDTRSNSAKTIEQKTEVLRLINSINPKLMEELNMDGLTPLLCKHIHCRLMIELIHLEANVLAKDLNNDTVLHLRFGWRELSSEDFHLFLSSIPQHKLKPLARMKGKQDRTPLGSLLELMDPAPETLVWFKEAGADFNCEDETGSSILEMAIKKGRNGKTIRKLIECGTKTVGWRGKNSETVLHVAACFGNLEATLLFLSGDHKIDVNVKDVHGFTPLDYILRSEFEHGNKLGTGRVLHEAGGKFMETVNSSGETWLRLSVQSGNIQSILLLLNIGVDVNSMDEEGNTSLHSVMTNYNSLKTHILEFLLDHDANPSILNKNGETPFHLALRSGLLDIETFKLLKSKTNVDWIPSLATSALNFVIINGGGLNENEFDEVAKEMDDHEADFNYRDDNGNSLLHIAISHNHTRAIRRLLNKQDVNLRNNLQQTPLHLAADKGLGLDVVKLLIENGGDVTAKDENNETFLHLYITNRPLVSDLHSLVEYLGSQDLLNLFNINGGEREATPFQLVVKYRVPLDETLYLLNLSGVDFNATDKYGLSVLGYAVEEWHGKRVNLLSSLIGFGADWNAITNHKSNMLHLSAQDGTSGFLEFFLNLGGQSVNEVDGDGRTPLHWVVVQATDFDDDFKKCKVLLDNGADVNILDAKGRTPLDYARLLRTDEIYKELRYFTASDSLKPQMVEEHDLITLGTFMSCMIDIQQKDIENYTILHKFVLQSNTPTPSEFHSVCEYLVGNTFCFLLNTPGGKLMATPFQEAVRLLEPNAVTMSLLHSHGIDFNAVDKNGESLLFYAVRGKRSKSFLSTLIKQYGADVAHLNIHHESVLHCAVIDGTNEALELSLDFKNLNVNGKNKDGLSSLHAFIKSSDCIFDDEALIKYRLLVDHGADVNSICNQHNTPLHSSTHNRRKDVSLKIIEHLVNDGANLYSRNSSSQTFIWEYIINEPFPTPSEFNDMVVYLKDWGYIDIFNEADKSGTTPIHFAVKYLEPEEKTLATLHSSDISFNIVDMQRDTILSRAVWGRRSEHFLSMLITRFGVSPTNIDCNGSNLLHLLVRSYNSDTLKYILDLSLPGLDINGKDTNGYTPLHAIVHIATMDDLQKCKLLVSYGSDVNSRNNQQQTPLHGAVAGYDKDISLKIVKYLVEHDADVFAKDQQNETFLHGYFDEWIEGLSQSLLHSLVEYLLNKGFAGIFHTPGGEYEQTPLHLIMRNIEPELKTLSLLHSRGVNFNAVDKSEISVLFSAVWGGRSTTLISQLVAQFGANHKYLNSRGFSILHFAALRGTVDALKLFADLDELDINGRTTYGDTPLICVICPASNKLDVLDKCRVLVSKGADVNIANNGGKTALSIMMESYDWTDERELMLLLRPSSANVSRWIPINTSESSDANSQ